MADHDLIQGAEEDDVAGRRLDHAIKVLYGILLLGEAYVVWDTFLRDNPWWEIRVRTIKAQWHKLTERTPWKIDERVREEGPQVIQEAIRAVRRER